MACVTGDHGSWSVGSRWWSGRGQAGVQLFTFVDALPASTVFVR